MNKINLKAGMGCACKISSDKLGCILQNIPRFYDENLLVGYDTSDDAAVYKVSDDIAIVQTLDFFTPLNEDPFVYGQIAAANAMSDVYAMGGEVITALNIVCFPENEDIAILDSILKGGASIVHKAKASLAGGHSIKDESIKYGLSVLGVVNPNNILQNRGAIAGDALILTKPLGVGIVNTANRIGMADKETMDFAIKSMTTLNKNENLKKYDIHACTDITGFGLAGHGCEMASSSNVCLELKKKDMYCIENAKKYASDFILTSAGQQNRNSFADRIDFSVLDFAESEILFDAQTSGGLLISLPQEQAEKAVAEFANEDIPAKIIGRVIEKHEKEMIFI